MRQILIGWLFEVHLKFKLLPETLFLTVNLIDRYTELKQIKKTDYQLLGITSMLIASKYEEIYPPEIRDFIFMTDKAYTKEQVLEMERDILR
jgi:G2/mitotic-specific cyclin-B, other